jgi:hypothetical protein
MKKGMTRGEDGMRNEPWNTQTAHTNLQRKPTPSQGR